MTDETKTFVFDLSKITLDEALAILEYDPKNTDPAYIARFVKAVRATIVNVDQFTGADLPGVIKAFTDSIMGGDEPTKN